MTLAMSCMGISNCRCSTRITTNAVSCRSPYLRHREKPPCRGHPAARQGAVRRRGARSSTPAGAAYSKTLAENPHPVPGRHVGLSRDEITEIVMQMAFYAGFQAALNSLLAAKEVFNSRASCSLIAT